MCMHSCICSSFSKCYFSAYCVLVKFLGTVLCIETCQKEWDLTSTLWGLKLCRRDRWCQQAVTTCFDVQMSQIKICTKEGGINGVKGRELWGCLWKRWCQRRALQKGKEDLHANQVWGRGKEGRHEAEATAHAKEQRQETEGVLGVASFVDLWRVRPRVRGDQTGRRKVTGEVGISPGKW